jgi:glucose-1-phosphate thymidylyltransferase
LLETNEHLLANGRARAPTAPSSGSTIIPPVYIEDGVSLRDARVGPNVSIETGSVVVQSTIANAILGRNVRITRSTVRAALVGDEQVIEGRVIERSVLDAGELAPAT